jgi:AAA+ superfamily predicted ATPase
MLPAATKIGGIMAKKQRKLGSSTAPLTGMWANMGSSIATLMFVWTIIRKYCPSVLRRSFENYTRRLMGYFNPYIRISFREFKRGSLRSSPAYAAVEAYLSANSSKDAKRLKAEMGKDISSLTLSMDEYESVTDDFEGATVWWVSTKIVSQSRSSMSYYPEPEKRIYTITFHKKHRELITKSYLEHVLSKGKEIRVRNRQRKLYTNTSDHKLSGHRQTGWSHIVFEHPATFESMAMEPEKKREIVEDLLTFSKSKDFYAKIGKAWKRGYLLYGPPGTGKSTMIAAMANLLYYDVYDLELTAVKDNTELRKLLIETTSKSIIIIEDIDCSLDLTGQRKNKTEKSSDGENEKLSKEIAKKEAKEEGSGSKVTLSGLLNFIDGLWSASRGERLIVFTTNYVEKLDPALIRRGRMDMHIELSYCSFEGFKVLAKNYLDLEMHPMFDVVQRLIGETKITPADVAENLMPKSLLDDAETRLSNLIEALEEAKEKAEEGKRSKEESEDVKEKDTTEAAKKKDEDVKEKDTTMEDAVQTKLDEETEKPL